MDAPPDLGKLLAEAIDKAVKERGHVNVLIAGRTGVGKSTLINSMFQGNFATTGQGRPVTMNVREFVKEGVPLTILDTRGLELANYQETLDKLKALVRERKQSSDPNAHIHVAWLCISEDSRRVEDAETALCEMLAEDVPVVGVITKARNDDGFRAAAQTLLPQASNVVRVRAIPETFDDGYELSAMGLLDLINLTQEAIPEGHRLAFAAAQKVSVAEKKRQAHKSVMIAASAAAGCGASPIPFSDAMILVPIQIGMLAKISVSFGLEVEKAFLMTLSSAAAGCTAAAFGGRALVANVLKFIPGGGSVLGGAISATTAAALTTTLGEIYIATLVQLFTKSGGTPPAQDEIIGEFKRRMKLPNSSESTLA